jgi:hypothetical protein
VRKFKAQSHIKGSNVSPGLTSGYEFSIMGGQTDGSFPDSGHQDRGFHNRRDSEVWPGRGFFPRRHCVADSHLSGGIPPQRPKIKGSTNPIYPADISTGNRAMSSILMARGSLEVCWQAGTGRFRVPAPGLAEG